MPVSQIVQIVSAFVGVVGALATVVYSGVIARGYEDKSVGKAKRSLQDIEQQALRIGSFEISSDPIETSDRIATYTLPSHDDEQGIESADLVAAADLVRSSAEMSRRQLEDAGKDRKNAATQQAIYFAVSVISGLAGIGVFLYGAYLVLNGQANIGGITALSSVIPMVFTGLLFKRADAAEKRLDQSSKRTNESVERVESMLRVIQALARMQDSAQRERILAMLSLRQMFPDAGLAELAAIADRIEPKKGEPGTTSQ